MFLSLKYFSQRKGIQQRKDFLEIWKILIKVNILLLNLAMPILS